MDGPQGQIVRDFECQVELYAAQSEAPWEGLSRDSARSGLHIKEVILSIVHDGLVRMRPRGGGMS